MIKVANVYGKVVVDLRVVIDAVETLSGSRWGVDYGFRIRAVDVSVSVFSEPSLFVDVG